MGPHPVLLRFRVTALAFVGLLLPLSFAGAQPEVLAVSDEAHACFDALYTATVSSVEGGTFRTPQLRAACGDLDHTAELTPEAEAAVSVLRFLTTSDYPDLDFWQLFGHLATGYEQMSRIDENSRVLAVFYRVTDAYLMLSGLESGGPDEYSSQSAMALSAALTLLYGSTNAQPIVEAYNGYVDRGLLVALAGVLPEEATRGISRLRLDGPGGVWAALVEVSAASFWSAGTCLDGVLAEGLIAENQDRVGDRGAALVSAGSVIFEPECPHLAEHGVTDVEIASIDALIEAYAPFDPNVLVELDRPAVAWWPSNLLTISPVEIAWNGEALAAGGALFGHDGAPPLSTLCEELGAPDVGYLQVAIDASTPASVFQPVLSAVDTGGCFAWVRLLIRANRGLGVLNFAYTRPVPSGSSCGATVPRPELLARLPVTATGELDETSAALVGPAVQSLQHSRGVAFVLEAQPETTFDLYLAAFVQLLDLCTETEIECSMALPGRNLPTLADQFLIAIPEDTGPRPELEHDVPTVSEGLEADVANRVLHQNRRRLRACYEDALQTDPTLGGGVLVRFLIDTTGAVSSVELVESDIDDASFVTCLSARIAALRFPTPQPEWDVSVQIRLVFSLPASSSSPN